MKTIWKYIMRPGNTTIEIPKDGKILSVKNQKEELCMWVEVDTSAPKELREFLVYGTGHEIVDKVGSTRTFLDTVMFHNAQLVFHIFEED